MAIPFDVWSQQLRNMRGQFVAVRDDVLERMAKHAEERAIRYAPVDTGELRRSITGQTKGLGTGTRTSQPRVFLSAPRKYAPIEFGSRRGHVAQRFLERGMADAVEWGRKEMADDVGRALLKGKAGHIGPRFSNRVL